MTQGGGSRSGFLTMDDVDEDDDMVEGARSTFSVAECFKGEEFSDERLELEFELEADWVLELEFELDSGEVKSSKDDSIKHKYY